MEEIVLKFRPSQASFFRAILEKAIGHTPGGSMQEKFILDLFMDLENQGIKHDDSIKIGWYR
jgi:hypothetical protein